jgi:hypothetical protein
MLLHLDGLKYLEAFIILHLNNVGIGTSVPRFNLELGPIGTSSTSLHVNGTSTFIGFVTTGNVFVGGALTATGAYQIDNISSGIIRASSIGIGTTNPLTPLQIGTASSLGVPTNGQIFAVTGIGSRWCWNHSTKNSLGC